MPDFESDIHTPTSLRRSRRDAEAADPARLAGRSSDGVGQAASLLQLQRLAGNASVVQMLAEDDEGGGRSPVHDIVGRGGGTPLDPGTRSTMESRLGADFGDVRIHTDAQASRSAEAVGANAYTVGSEMVFRTGHFDPGSSTGQRTLAHELTHVMQQRSGPVDGVDAPGGIRLSDPSDRFERAAEAMSTGKGPATTPAPPEVAQREVMAPEEDEEADDAATVQRELGGLTDEDEEYGEGSPGAG